MGLFNFLDGADLNWDWMAPGFHNLDGMPPFFQLSSQKFTKIIKIQSCAKSRETCALERVRAHCRKGKNLQKKE